MQLKNLYIQTHLQGTVRAFWHHSTIKVTQLILTKMANNSTFEGPASWRALHASLPSLSHSILWYEFCSEGRLLVKVHRIWRLCAYWAHWRCKTAISITSKRNKVLVAIKYLHPVKSSASNWLGVNIDATGTTWNKELLSGEKYQVTADKWWLHELATPR